MRYVWGGAALGAMFISKAIAEVEGGHIYAEQMTKRGMVPRWTLFRPHADAALLAWEGRDA